MSTLIDSRIFPSGQRLELIHGDLVAERVDAIVNAANAHLAHGGGVAAAISRAGGPAIQRESDLWVGQHGPVSHASPAYTGAGRLPYRYVIHAVGPVWGSGDEDTKLSQAIHGSLALADQLGLSSLAMPPISTGIFGFPKSRAAGLFYNTIQAYFLDHPASTLSLVRITILDQATLDVFRQAFLAWASQGR